MIEWKDQFSENKTLQKHKPDETISWQFFTLNNNNKKKKPLPDLKLDAHIFNKADLKKKWKKNRKGENIFKIVTHGAYIYLFNSFKNLIFFPNICLIYCTEYFFGLFLVGIT